MSRTVRVGFLGFGTVGTGAYRMLRDNKRAIEQKVGLPLEVVKIGIRDTAKARLLPSESFTTDLQAIVDDPEIDVVLELMGGLEPAAWLVERALNSGKSVVTANKEMMAKHGGRLVHIAKKKGLDLHYEAAVGGGIPLVQPLKHQLAGNELLRMMGILNGTTNYILTRMAEEGAEFADVLADAQRLGYAEADPTNDVDGFDSRYKLAILASIAFGRQVPVDGIYREGIRAVTKIDMHYAAVLGFKIKLLAICEPHEGKVLARVHPCLVPKEHPLAGVNGVYNALWFQGNFVGDVMFSGRGAGSEATASAVVGDLIDVGRNLSVHGPGSAIPWDEGMETASMDHLRSAYYLRLLVNDRPKVLGTVANLLGDHDVSLAAMEMRVIDADASVGEIVFLTHPCREGDFMAALQEIKGMESVREVGSSLRVIG